MNRPTTPLRNIPPIAPIRMTSIGTCSPRPRSIGFMKLSLTLTRMLHTVKTLAITTLLL